MNERENGVASAESDRLFPRIGAHRPSEAPQGGGEGLNSLGPVASNNCSLGLVQLLAQVVELESWHLALSLHSKRNRTDRD